MKKTLLTFLGFLSLSLSAQIGNNSFETWENDTAVVGFGLFPNDTVVFQDPIGWTSVNGLSNADTFGNVVLVSQSSDAFHGNFAIKCETQKLDTVFFQGIPFSLTIPGLILNGNFDFNPASLITGGTISPMSITTAGTPINTRKEKIYGHFKYAPVPGDSMIVWAVLKAGQTKVAEAIFQSNAAVSNYTYFEANFNYVSCLQPDTLVILVSSSLPDLASLFSGSGTGITPGSILLVDSLGTSELPANYEYPVYAVNDYDTIPQNGTASIDLSLNDANCDNDPLTYSLFNLPQGTATIAGSMLNYSTPNSTFLGLDSMSYDVTDGGTPSRAWVYILVSNSIGIFENNFDEISMFPNPANDKLTIRMKNTNEFVLNILDINGKIVKNAFAFNNTTLLINQLPSGIYTVVVSDKNGNSSKARFVKN